MPIQLPIGAEEKFNGVVDLVKMKAIYLGRGRPGHDASSTATIPAELARPTATKWREQMVEAAAEADDELMEKYLEGDELTEDEIKRGLRARTIRSEIVPVLCGSAFKNKGVQALLDAVVDYLPSPTDVTPIEGTLEDGSRSMQRAADDDAPFAPWRSRSRPTRSSAR